MAQKSDEVRGKEWYQWLEECANQLEIDGYIKHND